MTRNELSTMAREKFEVKTSRLWRTKNLLITPHVAGKLTLDCTKDKNVEMFLEDLQNFASGKAMKYIVNKKLGY